jgi:hypothetical protein
VSVACIGRGREEKTAKKGACVHPASDTWSSGELSPSGEHQDTVGSMQGLRLVPSEEEGAGGINPLTPHSYRGSLPGHPQPSTAASSALARGPAPGTGSHQSPPLLPWRTPAQRGVDMWQPASEEQDGAQASWHPSGSFGILRGPSTRHMA